VDFAHDLHRVAFTDGGRGGGPFTNAVESEYQRLVKGAGEEGAGGVGLVMFREEQFTGPVNARGELAELLFEAVFLEQLISYS
jgi:hypothetical protein